MTEEKFKFGATIIENKIVGPVYYRHFKHLYTLEPGDKWCWLGDEVVVANAEKIPFTINLVTGERKNIEVGPDVSTQWYHQDRTWYGSNKGDQP